MSDVLKNLLYAGAGFAAYTVERVQKTVDDLVSKGKITDKEGSKIVNDFLKNSEAKKDEIEKKLKKATEEVVKKFNFVSLDELNSLEKRVKSLEVKLGKMNKDAVTSKPKTTAKKDKAVSV